MLGLFVVVVVVVVGGGEGVVFPAAVSPVLRILSVACLPLHPRCGTYPCDQTSALHDTPPPPLFPCDAPRLHFRACRQSSTSFTAVLTPSLPTNICFVLCAGMFLCLLHARQNVGIYTTPTDFANTNNYHRAWRRPKLTWTQTLRRGRRSTSSPSSFGNSGSRKCGRVQCLTLGDGGGGGEGGGVGVDVGWGGVGGW